jgi:hypothetical protein
MNKFFVILGLLILLGCSSDIKFKEGQKISQKQKIVNQIRFKAAKFIEKEKGLKPCGTGAQMMFEVKMLALAFVYNQPIDIQQGRELLVYATETFLSMINEDERIHSYLFNYPFEPKNVEIEIYIRNPTNSFVEPGKLCLVSTQEGKCTYHVRDTKTGRLENIYKETFQEAKEKIKVN